MTESDRIYFKALKEKVSKKFLDNHSAPFEIGSWNGTDIALFQEDLLVRVNGRVSEKWFYTYFKNEPTKLPRIDMLNLLSNYIGFKNWNHFKKSLPIKESRKTKNRLIVTIFPLIFILITLLILFFQFRSKTYNFCFYDEDKRLPVIDIALDIKILSEKETPIYLKTNDNGCFEYKTYSDKIKFVVQSPYHKTDTIIRSLKSVGHNTINLRTDYYAQMLEYLANGDKKEWERYKLKLDGLVSDDVVIYQLHKNNIGVEIFTKEEFIRKLTLPTNSLKKIKIIDKTVKDGKINQLKFMIE